MTPWACNMTERRKEGRRHLLHLRWPAIQPPKWLLESQGAKLALPGQSKVACAGADLNGPPQSLIERLLSS